MSIPAHLSQSEDEVDIRISAASFWFDRIWQLDVIVPGTVSSDLRIDWGFILPDSSRFTDAKWIRWCKAAKTFLWTLRTTPSHGRRGLRDASLVRMYHKLRVLICWMITEGYDCFADLDNMAGERFLAFVAARPGRNGRPFLAETTVVRYAHLLDLLYIRRHVIPDAPGENPLGHKRVQHLRRWHRNQGSSPYTPDTVAIPLVSAAIRLIGRPADDVLALRDRIDEAGGRDTHDQRVTEVRIYNELSDFRFSVLEGEQRPWRAEAVAGVGGLQFLLTRLYDACFVVIAYLIGARVSEILSLKTGCILMHMSADHSEEFAYLHGRIYKTANGAEGEPHRWVAPEPVVRAVAVLERLSAPLRHVSGRDDLWLTSNGPGDDEPSVHIHRAAGFNARLNGSFAAFINLPHYNGRPWHLTTHQGRKTFARFVGRRDRTGLHALAAHFGHVTRVMTDASYVGSDFELAELIDEQIFEETRDALEELLTASRLAGKAGRTIAAGSRFRGRTRDGDVKEYVDFILQETDMRLGVCDWGYCVYRRENAACHGDERGPNPVLRTQSLCAGCVNFTAVEKHRPVWAERRRRSAELLLHPALDPESRMLAVTRVEECNRILSQLDEGQDVQESDRR